MAHNAKHTPSDDEPVDPAIIAEEYTSFTHDIICSASDNGIVNHKIQVNIGVSPAGELTVLFKVDGNAVGRFSTSCWIQKPDSMTTAINTDQE